MFVFFVNMAHIDCRLFSTPMRMHTHMRQHSATVGKKKPIRHGGRQAMIFLNTLSSMKPQRSALRGAGHEYDYYHSANPEPMGEMFYE